MPGGFVFRSGYYLKTYSVKCVNLVAELTEAYNCFRKLRISFEFDILFASYGAETNMRRLVLMPIVLVVFALFAFGAASVSAEAVCYRATATFGNTDVEMVIVYDIAWQLSGGGSVTAIPDYVYVRNYEPPKTVVWEENFDGDVPLGLNYTAALFSTGHAPTNFTADISVAPCDGAPTPEGAFQGPRIVDGRVNSGDLAAPAAVYCGAGGALDIWDIDAEGNGTPGIFIPREDIDAALEQAAATGLHVLVRGWGDKQLYALTWGDLMIVGYDLKEPGKLYQAVISGDTCP